MTPDPGRSPTALEVMAEPVSLPQVEVEQATATDTIVPPTIHSSPANEHAYPANRHPQPPPPVPPTADDSANDLVGADRRTRTRRHWVHAK